jgi:hypothetical protein
MIEWQNDKTMKPQNKKTTKLQYGKKSKNCENGKNDRVDKNR